jgi:hypothetical protein
MTDPDAGAHMARTSAEAARKKRKHEKTVQEQPDQTTQLRRLWSWVLAELKTRPDHTEHALAAVRDLAEELNERSTR